VARRERPHSEYLPETIAADRFGAGLRSGYRQDRARRFASTVPGIPGSCAESDRLFAETRRRLPEIRTPELVVGVVRLVGGRVSRYRGRARPSVDRAAATGTHLGPAPAAGQHTGCCGAAHVSAL
jgi:hypothetical protein